MFGAGGRTKSEIIRGLKYKIFTLDDVAEYFESFTENVRKTNGLKIGKSNCVGGCD
jgi:hypothetical protein